MVWNNQDGSVAAAMAMSLRGLTLVLSSCPSEHQFNAVFHKSRYIVKKVLNVIKVPFLPKKNNLEHERSCEWDGQFYFKFYVEKGVPPFYRMMPKILDFLGSIAVFSGERSRQSLFFWGRLCSNHERAQHRGTSFLVAFNMYRLHLVPCEI